MSTETQRESAKAKRNDDLIKVELTLEDNGKWTLKTRYRSGLTGGVMRSTPGQALAAMGHDEPVLRSLIFDAMDDFVRMCRQVYWSRT